MFNTSRSAHADKGKWAEKQVQDYLDKRSAETCGFTYHRYPDARSARGALAAQPADFLVAWRAGPQPSAWSRAWHLEVKETKELKRLPKKKIGQYGKLKLFDLAGIRPYILIYRSSFKDWYLMDHIDLFAHEECPSSFPFDGREVFPTAATALATIFK